MGARNQWSAKTMHRSKKYTLGYFADKQSAVDAYMMAVRAKSNGTIDSHLETIGAKVTVGSRGPNKPKEGMLHLQTRDLVLDEHYFPDGRKRKRRRKYTGPLPKEIKRSTFCATIQDHHHSHKKRRFTDPEPTIKLESAVKREPAENFAEDFENRLKSQMVLAELKPRPVVTQIVRSGVKAMYGRFGAPLSSNTDFRSHLDNVKRIKREKRKQLALEFLNRTSRLDSRAAVPARPAHRQVRCIINPRMPDLEAPEVEE